MKKLFFAMACVIGMMFFASCNPDAINDMLKQKPTVEFVSGDNLVSSFDGFWVGTELHFQIEATPNATSKSPIASIHFAIHDLQGTTVVAKDYTDFNGSEPVIIEETFSSNAPSTYVVSASIKDEAGKENFVEITVDYVEPIEAYIGTFEGMVTIEGDVKANQTLPGVNIDDHYTAENLFTTITLGTVSEENRVIATFEIDGRPVSLYCTRDEETGNLTFDEFHFNRTILLVSNIGINLDLHVNATAEMTEGKLNLNGTAYGTGALYGISLVSASATLSNGTITGEFNEVTE